MKLLYTAALCLCVLTTGIPVGCERSEGQSRTFYTDVRSVDKLVLAQMTISKMATVEDLKLEEAEGLRQTVEALGDAVKIGTRKGAYSYDTYMRAFIDMSALAEDDVTVDEKSKSITIDLPPIQTELAGRDAGIREDHYRVTGLRSDIDAKERAEIKEKMNAALKRELETNPAFRTRLVEQARAKARAFFTSLGEAHGYTVTVNFK